MKTYVLKKKDENGNSFFWKRGMGFQSNASVATYFSEMEVEHISGQVPIVGSWTEMVRCPHCSATLGIRKTVEIEYECNDGEWTEMDRKTTGYDLFCTVCEHSWNEDKED